MKLGAHLSISGGYETALHKIVKIGGNSLQIFSASPRGWNFAQFSDQTIKSFIDLKQQLDVDPIYFHASYLINLGDDARIGQLSKQLLIHELKGAAKLGVRGSIVHLGSFKLKETPLLGIDAPDKYSCLIQNIEEVLKNTPEETNFYIENAGNRKIGKSLDEIANIIRDVNNPRLKVCLDTCHLHAAGYRLNTKEDFEQFILDFDKNIGLDRLEVWHVNDSRDPFGSLRDRHANIGQGAVGIEAFKLLLNHPKTKNHTFIIETPGFDDNGPDKENLDILKGYITS